MKMNNRGITNRGMSDIAYADIMKSKTIYDSILMSVTHQCDSVVTHSIVRL